jgi:hypothetical protein
MISFNKKLGFLLFACVFTLASCVEFKKIALYDGDEPIVTYPIPTDLSLIVESLIYDEDATDVWGLQKDICQEARVSSKVAYSGQESLKVTWNRDARGCKFAAIGIGWDGYAGKDLSQIMGNVAIQMHVRTEKGRSFGLPMVLTLIDYSGGMGFSYITNKYFERTTIDEEWQKVIVPLSSFDIEKENLDPSNIAQLQIELQQNGSVYLDDISLVFYEEKEAEKPWMVEEKLPSAIAAPIQIFDDAFINNNVWGLISDECQKIELTNTEYSEGNKSLHVRWDTRIGNCKLTSFGVSWNKWNPVDLTSVKDAIAFQFDLKMASGSASTLPFFIGFEDYERAKTFVNLKSEFVEGGQYTADWKQVTVPVSAIPAKVDIKRIKQLYFNLEGAGEVYIDNLKMVKL